ncbi:MAG TPA: VCBS repeat-containing protein, partial [Planctomycetota bacterium]|nr:VCBS repeat-containing protein [Planctomycetota bacterium]
EARGALAFAAPDGGRDIAIVDNFGAIEILPSGGGAPAQLAGFPGSPAIAVDLDGSGKPALVGFTADRHLARFGREGPIAISKEPAPARWLVAADLDGDRRPEIVAGDEKWIAAYGRDGAWLWSAKPRGGQAREWITADLNGDGREEVVILASREPSPQSEVFALGAGGARTVVAKGMVAQLQAADLDGNGSKAVLLAGSASIFESLFGSTSIAGRVVAFRGDGTTLFDRSTESSVTKLVSGDLDGDGRAEAIAGTSGGGLVVFAHDGSTRHEWTLGSSVDQLAVGDLAGDGSLQVVAGTVAGDLVAFDREGARRLVARLGSGIVKLVAGDLDGEPGAEIVAADRSGRVTIWKESRSDPRIGERRDALAGIESIERGDLATGSALLERARLRWLAIDPQRVADLRARLARAAPHAPAASRVLTTLDRVRVPTERDVISTARTIARAGALDAAAAYVRSRLDAAHAAQTIDAVAQEVGAPASAPASSPAPAGTAAARGG